MVGNRERDGIACRSASLCDRRVDLARERLDDPGTQSGRGLGRVGAAPRVGNAYGKTVSGTRKHDVYAAALRNGPRMPNGVGDELVHDEREGHGHVSGDDERIGADDQRPIRSGAARRSGNLLTKIDDIGQAPMFRRGHICAVAGEPRRSP